MQHFLIYLFLQVPYVFQAVPPPIIRSTQLYIQLQLLSTNTAACCYRGWYLGLLRPVWCKLFSVTLLHFPCSTCFGCNIHPSSGASYNAHAAGTFKCTCELTRSMPNLASNWKADTAWNCQLTRALTCTGCMCIIWRSWGWMYIASETCRAGEV